MMIDTNDVFRALGDPSRRRMLDLIKAHPGISVGELSASFSFTRYGVMKHLRNLSEAGLVTSERDGKHRRLYINVIPIQTIYDRWISKYSAMWASKLTGLKYSLENTKTAMSTSLKHRYVIYIRTTPEDLWNAITNPDLTQQYFHNTRVESGFAAGSPIDYMLEKDGGTRSALTGEVVEIIPFKRLVHTFLFASADEAPSRVTYEIEEVGDLVKLTLTHDQFDGETETYKSVSEGWPPVLSSLKTLLETGRALEIDYA